MRRAARIAIVGVVAAVTSMPASSPDGISAQVAEWSLEHAPTISVERFLDRAPRRDHVPMVDQVEIGNSGLVWVREYVLDETEATWQVLDPGTGSTAARLRAPAAWEMLRPGPTSSSSSSGTPPTSSSFASTW